VFPQKSLVILFFQPSKVETVTPSIAEMIEPMQPIECYEYLESALESTRGNLRFWIEGVLIFGIGCLGLAGNTVTVLVLRRYRKNRTFNILIIW
jgi:hypothetical protein